MPQSIPTPKISGLLNNCMMNCALPYILVMIQALSEFERTGARFEEPDDFIYIHYKKLKDLFAQTYGIEEVDLFTWQQLHALTSSHSFLANEIIFAPVFRHFIASVALENGYAAEDLWRIRDIQTHMPESPEDMYWPGGQNPSAGKYNPLDASEGINLFHRCFGIEPRLYETDAPDAIIGLNFSTFTPPLYFKDGHYELQPNDHIAGPAADAHTAEMNALPAPLSKILDLFSTSDSRHQTLKGLACLFLYVNRLLRRNELDGGDVDLLASLQDYYFTGRLFHDDTVAGRQAFSLALLTINIEKGVAHAARMKGYMLKLSSLSESQADQLAINIIQCQGDLSAASFTSMWRTIEQKQLTMQALRVLRRAPPVIDFPNPTLTADFTLKCIIGLAAAGVAILCVAVILALAVNTTASMIVGGLGVTAIVLSGMGLFHSRESPDAAIGLQHQKGNTL